MYNEPSYYLYSPLEKLVIEDMVDNKLDFMYTDEIKLFWEKKLIHEEYEKRKQKRI